jgi:Kef-type K+ transport system membrane component KefB
MSANEFGMMMLSLSVLLVSVHIIGYLFEKLRQPKLVGEILAGILLGPWVLKLLAPNAFAMLFPAGGASAAVYSFLYNLGLILLMFCAGTETRRLLAKENRKQTATLIGVADIVNFSFVLALGFAGMLPLAALTGPKGTEMATLLVVAIAVSVTSIPVISRIFWDLRIMHTRFVSLILGASVVEDIALWAVLAVATALAAAGAVGKQVVDSVTGHVLATAIYMVVAMVIAPGILRRLASWKWNILHRATPVGYLLVILFVYCAVASAVGVNIQFAALLAGFGVVGGIQGTDRHRVAVPLDAISKVSFAVFVPIYFGIIGYRLVFGREFSMLIMLGFLFGSTILSVITGGLAAKASGFRGLDLINIALTTNARGGPGIVLASVAYDAGLINAAFFTTLVLTAVFTSQLAGAWLRYVLKKGWPLLSTNPEETWLPAPQAVPEAAVSGSASLQPAAGEVAA